MSNILYWSLSYLCVCVYVFVCVCVCVCVYVCVYTCMHMRVYVCMCVRTRMCVCAHMRAHVCVCVCVFCIFLFYGGCLILSSVFPLCARPSRLCVSIETAGVPSP